MATKSVTKWDEALAGKTRYLIERSGRFHVRIVIPKHLRPILKRTELRRSLGSDRRLALKSLPGVVATFLERIATAQAQFLQASGKSTSQHELPVLTAAQAAQAHFAEGLAFDSQARDGDHRFAGGFIDDIYVADLQRVVSGAASTREMLGTVGRIVQRSQLRGSPTHAAGSSEWRNLARRLAQAELASLNLTAHRDEGHQDPPLPNFADPLVYVPALNIQPLISSIRRVFEGYRNELQRSGKAKNAEKRWSPVVENLLLILGHDDARRITRHDVIRWKDLLSESFSPKTVRDTYLATARSAFTWAVDNLHVEQNPFLGVKVRLGRKALGRPKGFSDEEAIGILKKRTCL